MVVVDRVGVGVGCSAKQPDESQTSMRGLGENPPAGVGWGVMTTLARRQLSPSLLPAQKSKLHGAFALVNSHTGPLLVGAASMDNLSIAPGLVGPRGTTSSHRL